MKNLKFKYITHPGDFFRNTDVLELPNPDENLEDFLIWFCTNYMSDDRVAYLDDLYKSFHDEFTNEEDRIVFMKSADIKTYSEIQEEIQSVEASLKHEAYVNFYQLLLTNKIEIIYNKAE
ncbi:MAG: hypothetical protein H7296_09130 [Bacteroidia bacterium]|nr:hypothetical protein [Bacteroidia bacterium]